MIGTVVELLLVMLVMWLHQIVAKCLSLFEPLYIYFHLC